MDSVKILLFVIAVVIVGGFFWAATKDEHTQETICLERECPDGFLRTYIRIRTPRCYCEVGVK